MPIIERLEFRLPNVLPGLVFLGGPRRSADPGGQRGRHRAIQRIEVLKHFAPCARLL